MEILLSKAKPSTQLNRRFEVSTCRHVSPPTSIAHTYIYIYVYIEHANNIHQNIKFTHERSKTTLPFLDVSVQIAQNKIFTTLHKKPTDSHSYLHYNSCHPVHIKNSIIYSQFLRYKRICTRNKDFIDHSKELTTHLLHKAYPIKVISKQWNKVTKIPRTELLVQKQQTTNKRTACLSYRHTIRPLSPLTKLL